MRGRTRAGLTGPIGAGMANEVRCPGEHPGLESAFVGLRLPAVYHGGVGDLASRPSPHPLPHRPEEATSHGRGCTPSRRCAPPDPDGTPGRSMGSTWLTRPDPAPLWHTVHAVTWAMSARWFPFGSSVWQIRQSAEGWWCKEWQPAQTSGSRHHPLRVTGRTGEAHFHVRLVREAARTSVGHRALGPRRGRTAVRGRSVVKAVTAGAGILLHRHGGSLVAGVTTESHGEMGIVEETSPGEGDGVSRRGIVAKTAGSR